MFFGIAIIVFAVFVAGVVVVDAVVVFLEGESEEKQAGQKKTEQEWI